jgi:hypothetical protein
MRPKASDSLRDSNHAPTAAVANVSSKSAPQGTLASFERILNAEAASTHPTPSAHRPLLISSTTSARGSGGYLDAFLEERPGADADAVDGARSLRSVAGGSVTSSRPLFDLIWASGSDSVKLGGGKSTSLGGHGSVDGGGSHSSRGNHSGVAASDYADVFSGLPMMDSNTKEALVRANCVANSRKMGYADSRPDIRPLSYSRVAPEHSAQMIEFNGNGAHGCAMAKWAGSLRPSLYSASADPARAFASGDDIKTAWDGSGLAPSEVTPSYAFRHAQSTSVWAPGAGNVYDRLLDVRGYTGTHRHRFDVSTGRGLGLQSRENYAYLRSRIETEHDRGAPVLPEPLDVGPHAATLSSRYVVK